MFYSFSMKVTRCVLLKLLAMIMKCKKDLVGILYRESSSTLKLNFNIFLINFYCSQCCRNK